MSNWDKNSVGGMLTDEAGDRLYLTPDGDGMIIGVYGQPLDTHVADDDRVYAAVKVTPADFDIVVAYLAELRADVYQKCEARVTWASEAAPHRRRYNHVDFGHARTRGLDDLTAARRIVATAEGVDPTTVLIRAIEYNDPA